MKYKDNDKKGDSFWDRMIDDLIWGAPLGGGVGINLKTGNIIPYPSFDEDNHHDWDNDEFSFDDLADFADDEDNNDGDHTLSFSLTFDSNKTAPDFSPRDGKTIEVSVFSDSEAATIQFRDHGPGIPENELPHVTEKFYKGSSSKERGSGIGLAVCDEIITRSGGTLTIANAPGGGTLVSVRLPFAPESGN